jgi:hypothetical protein
MADRGADVWGIERLRFDVEFQIPDASVLCHLSPDLRPLTSSSASANPFNRPTAQARHDRLAHAAAEI